MSRLNKQKETKVEERRRGRRGKRGREAAIRQALAGGADSFPDQTPTPQSLRFLSVSSEVPAKVVKPMIPIGPYAERLAFDRTLDKPRFRQDLEHSANVVVAED